MLKKILLQTETYDLSIQQFNYRLNKQDEVIIWGVVIQENLYMNM